jgi:transposase
VEHLERVDVERQAAMEQLHAQIELLTEQNTLLRKALFSRRRERYVPSAEQKLLFDPEALDSDPGEAPAVTDSKPSEDDAEEDAEETSISKKLRRPKRKRFEFPQCLPVRQFEHPLPPEELPCPCGCGDRIIIGKKVSRQLEIQRETAYVAEHIRYVYGCRRHRDGEHLVTTDKPASVNDKGVFGSSALAYLGQAKFERHLPLYRLQEELESATTMWFNRSVLSNAILRTGNFMRPLWDLMHEEVLRSFYLRVDETTAKVLRPGTGKTQQVYLWVYVGDNDHPYLLFDYHLYRSRAGPREILGNFRGGLLTDGHSAYTALIKESDGALIDLGCWAHARRRFDEALAVTSHALAPEALAWIWKLYDIEDRVRDASAGERLVVRQRESTRIVERLHARLVEVQPTQRPSSKLADAIGYLLNRWDAMTRYTTDGRYEIDNNAAERSLRPSVIGRKNYLFFGSDSGGAAACIWYTIIQSARHNRVNVLPYLNDVLVRLPQIVPEYLTVGEAASPYESLTGAQRDALRALLPDRWLKEHPDHRQEERQRELEQEQFRRRNRRAKRRLVKA